MNSLVSNLPLLSSNGLLRLLEVNKYNEIHTPQKVVMCYKLYSFYPRFLANLGCLHLGFREGEVTQSIK